MYFCLVNLYLHDLYIYVYIYINIYLHVSYHSISHIQSFRHDIQNKFTFKNAKCGYLNRIDQNKFSEVLPPDTTKENGAAEDATTHNPFGKKKSEFMYPFIIK